MANGKKKDAVVVADATAYPVLVPDQGMAMLDMAIEQLGPGGHFGLTRLGVPGSGGAMWEIETRKGPESVPTLNCIVAVLRMKQRAWYRASFDETGGGSPPECGSADSIHGRGCTSDDPAERPGEHACATCPRNVFREDDNNFGTECSEFAQALIFREGSRLPGLLHISITSLKSWRSYLLGLADDGLMIRDVVTSIALESDKSRRGIKYAKQKPTTLRDLNDEERALMNEVHTKCAAWMATPFARAAQADAPTGA